MSGLITHTWFSGLFADPEIAEILSPTADLARYREIEIAWTLALAEVGNAEVSLCEQAAHHIATCDIADETLRAGVVVDGLPIPAFVRGLKANISAELQKVVHFGLTSQDIMDTSLILAIKSILTIYKRRLGALVTNLETLRADNGGNHLMGYTRMQAALPITADARISTWIRPVQRYLTDVDRIADQLDILQWGGPVGLRDIPNADRLGPAFAARLGLRDPEFAWHTTRADIAELGAFLARIAGSLGKMGQDIALMAQRGSRDITLKSGGTSSAMPHKQNPIRAELLVTMAQYTTQQAASLTAAMVHEQERSGGAWVLEMVTLPYMLQLCGAALANAHDLTEQIITIGSVDLDDTE